jgi:hypothetical protein
MWRNKTAAHAAGALPRSTSLRAGFPRFCSKCLALAGNSCRQGGELFYRRSVPVRLRPNWLDVSVDGERTRSEFGTSRGFT